LLWAKNVATPAVKSAVRKIALNAKSVIAAALAARARHRIIVTVPSSLGKQARQLCTHLIYQVLLIQRKSKSLS
jgi:hypothetical protein